MTTLSSAPGLPRKCQRDACGARAETVALIAQPASTGASDIGHML